MPELPEVETTARMLHRAIAGRNISDAWMDPRKPVNLGTGQQWQDIRNAIRGRRIASVGRRAKYIVFRLQGGSSLWVHQKMTGHFLIGRWVRSAGTYRPAVAGPLADDPMNRFIRVLLTLDDGSHVALSDARRFARIILVAPSAGDPVRLGPEPLELDMKRFTALMASRRGMVKSTLMDPAFVAGIGNIYADEILHRAGIHPFSPMQHLTVAQAAAVRRHMRTILTAAIRAGGSSMDDYRTPDGRKGGYQSRHRAYGHAGRLCTLCGNARIVRVMRNGRSSHFCPSHQPLLP